MSEATIDNDIDDTFEEESVTEYTSETPARAVVTIAHFNDVYEIGPVEGGKTGGLARLTTVIKQLKRGAAPVLADQV